MIYDHIFEQWKSFKQNGGTCYAHSIATSLIQAEIRIRGRVPQKHDLLVQRLINKYEDKVTDISPILQVQCSQKQLRFKIVSEKEALKVIQQGKRPIIGVFWLTKQGWNNFKEQINKYESVINDKIKTGNEGHAVNICGTFNSKYHQPFWYIKNSWGQSWGQKGYFGVKLGSIEMVYYDVFFLEKDLTEKDRQNFKKFKQNWEKQYKRRYDQKDVQNFVNICKEVIKEHGQQAFINFSKQLEQFQKKS